MPPHRLFPGETPAFLAFFPSSTSPIPGTKRLLGSVIRAASGRHRQRRGRHCAGRFPANPVKQVPHQRRSDTPGRPAGLCSSDSRALPGSTSPAEIAFSKSLGVPCCRGKRCPYLFGTRVALPSHAKAVDSMDSTRSFSRPLDTEETQLIEVRALKEVKGFGVQTKRCEARWSRVVNTPDLRAQPYSARS